MKKLPIFFFLSLCYSLFADQEKTAFKDSNKAPTASPGLGISSNAAAVNIVTGTGALGRWLGLKSGITLGGLWIGDANFLCHGGLTSSKFKKFTGNSLFILSLSLDAEKLIGLPGGSVGIEYLQFNGQNTNVYAGVAQGYNSLPGPKPLDRSELYQAWYRQAFFDEKLIIRLGKTIPTYDFNNVIRPVSTHDEALSIPAVTGLIYTPIFVNSSMLGVLPGYYNSAYGITATFVPNENLYFSCAAYDGNLARGVQTGIRVGPTINKYSFSILEGGGSWFLGAQKKPGMAALGGWFQTGKLSTSTGITENGAQGFYLFGSQRLWFHHAGQDNSGISGFYQFGINNSKTLPFKKYLGLGLTAFALVPNRPKDSMGTGMALAWLNKNVFQHKNEVILQMYYQMYLVKSIYWLTALSYIPHPGLPNSKPHATALTSRIILLF